MDQYIKLIEKNNVWELKSLPSMYRNIGIKCIFKIKNNENRDFEKYKERLEAKG